MKKALKILAVLAVVAVLTLFVGARLFHVASPITLARSMGTNPSEAGRIYPSVPIKATANPADLPAGGQQISETVLWKGERISVTEFLDLTNTRAFMVLNQGKVSYEWYDDNTDESTLLSSWSMAKSLVSILVGHQIEADRLNESDLLVDILPELKTGSSAYDDITIKDLLDMQSGIAGGESYDVSKPLSGTSRLYISTDIRGLLKDRRAMHFKPGSKGEYLSVNSQLLSMVVTRVAGKPIPEVLQDEIWGPIGAEFPATWNVDRNGGIAKGFCCFNASLRDFARVGLHIADPGPGSIVSMAQTNRFETMAEHPVKNGWHYSAQFWHGPDGGKDFSAIGVFGQFIYVNRETGTVIVKLSDDEREKNKLATFEALRSIADGF